MAYVVRVPFSLDLSVDLSYEVLNIDYVQGAAKISEVKVGGQKKSADAASPGRKDLNQAESADIFLTSNFDLKYLCSPLTKINV